MVVVGAKELRELEAHCHLACCIEEHFGRLVDLCQTLWRVNKYDTFIYQIVLRLQQIRIRHDALKIINILNSGTKDLAERHEDIVLDTLQIIQLIEVVSLHHSNWRSSLLIEYRYSDCILKLFNLQFFEILLFRTHHSLLFLLTRSIGSWGNCSACGGSVDVFFDHNPSMSKRTARESQIRSHSDWVDPELANNLIGFGANTVKVVDVFVVHEEYDPLRLEDTDTKLVYFRNHGYQKRVQRLVHQPLHVPQFFVTFLFDIILHLMSNQTIGNLITNILKKQNVIGCEILCLSFICYFNATNCVITKLNRTNQYVSGDCMQLLVK